MPCFLGGTLRSFRVLLQILRRDGFGCRDSMAKYRFAAGSRDLRRTDLLKTLESPRPGVVMRHYMGAAENRDEIARAHDRTGSQSVSVVAPAIFFNQRERPM